MVIFTTRPLYPLPGEKSPWYPVVKKLDGPQNQSRWRGENIVSLHWNSGGWIPIESTWHWGHQYAYCASPGWLWWRRNWWLARETEVLGRNMPSATLPPQIRHTCPDANPGRRGGKPATNHLSYGTAKKNVAPTGIRTPTSRPSSPQSFANHSQINPIRTLASYSFQVSFVHFIPWISLHFMTLSVANC
jgi:hypothetical protein